MLDFDDASTVPGNNTTSNPGTFSNTVFTASPASNSGNYAFMVGTSYTPTVGSGPISDFSKNGNYLVAEGDYGISPTSATLVSRCLDLSGMTEPVLQFRHHMYGADIGAIRVQWVQAGENFWSNPMSPYIVTLADEKDPWSHYELDLSTQAGNIIKIRLIAQKTGLGVAADIAFDDISIFDKSNIDVGVDRINTPGARINMTGGPGRKAIEYHPKKFW